VILDTAKKSIKIFGKDLDLIPIFLNRIDGFYAPVFALRYPNVLLQEMIAREMSAAKGPGVI